MDTYIAPKSDNPRGGWKLEGCQVEEYPFGSGNPDRSESGNSILRLIPGGNFARPNWENQAHGSSLKNWVNSVVTRYNAQPGVPSISGANGIKYCVTFDPSFTSYLPEQQVTQNFCAARYGVEFTLVNDYEVNGQRTWDPWFDVPNTNREESRIVIL